MKDEKPNWACQPSMSLHAMTGEREGERTSPLLAVPFLIGLAVCSAIDLKQASKLL